MTSGIFEIDDDFQKDVGPSSDDDEISEEVRRKEIYSKTNVMLLY